MMSSRGLCALTASALLFVPAMGRAQYFEPGPGLVRGPDLRYYPVHKYGDAVMREVNKWRRAQSTYGIPMDNLGPLRPRIMPPQRRVVATTRSAPEYSGPNLGISFRLVEIGGVGGARLTRTPAPDTAASKLGLEAGDTIC